MISSFFKKTRYKTFEYTPRYYDEAKEKMKDRYDRIQAELDGKDAAFSKDRFRNNLRESWQNNKKTSSPQAKSIVRMLVIAVILILLSYFILG